MARLHVYIMTRVLTTITHAEPGYYADGRYGIRIENVVVVREAHTPHNFGDKGYLRFEHVTLVRCVSSRLCRCSLCTLLI